VPLPTTEKVVYLKLDGAVLEFIYTKYSKNLGILFIT